MGREHLITNNLYRDVICRAPWIDHRSALMVDPAYGPHPVTHICVDRYSVQLRNVQCNYRQPVHGPCCSPRTILWCDRGRLAYVEETCCHPRSNLVCGHYPINHCRKWSQTFPDRLCLSYPIRARVHQIRVTFEIAQNNRKENWFEAITEVLAHIDGDIPKVPQ